VPKRVFPRATAYKENLYSIPGVPEHLAEFVEREFLRVADQQASDALKEILAGKIDLSQKLRNGWARFLMSLMSRTPDRVTWIKEQYAEEFAKRVPDLQMAYDSQHAADPTKPTASERVAEIERAVRIGAGETLQRVMDLPRVGLHLSNMPWAVLECETGRFSFLTGDRPAYLSDGLAKQSAVLTLPIAPTKLFVAANDAVWLSKLERQPPGEIVESSNSIVAGNAVDFVYGVDDRQLRYVENRLRRVNQPISSIVPRLR
jgi:hypothetical protein